MAVFSDHEIRLLAEQYQKHYRPAVAYRFARELVSALDPRLADTLRRWLQTGEEQPFSFNWGEDTYSLRSVQALLHCNYLTALERMNDFVRDPENNYYRILPC